MWTNLPLPVRTIVVSLAFVLGARAVAGAALAAIFRATRNRRLVRELRFPLCAMAYLLGTYMALCRIDLDPGVSKIADSATYVLFVLLLTYLCVKGINHLLRWYSENIACKTETRLDDEFLPLLKYVLKLAVYVIMLVTILSHFGQNISALLTVFGVGSLAIGLASQEIIANMLAGFIIMLDRPFTLGDRVKLQSGETGTVEEMRLRNTRIRLADSGAVLIVSNLELMRTRLQNLDLADDKRRDGAKTG